MAKSLSDIVSLVKHGDDNILEEQEKTNTTLESIDRNMKAFLDGQKNSRLDDLEDRREKKRPSGGGLIKGAAIGAAAGGALELASGDRIDPRLLLSGGALLGAAFGPLKRAITKVVSAIGRNLNDVARHVNTRIAALDAELDARIKAINEEIRLRKKALEDSATARKKLNADIEANRVKMTVQELIADEEARTETRKRTQAEVEKFQRQGDNLAKNKKALEAARIARAGKARRAAIKAIELDMEFDPRSPQNLNRAQYGGALDTRADRALMQTGTDVANARANAAADRGLMATADEQTKINQNRAADRRLAEQAQERSRRLQLGSDASSAADKRKFNADVRAAALQLEVEQLKAANLKRVMSLSDGPPSVKAFQDASRPGAFLSFQEANERIGTLGMEGTTAAPRARPTGTNMMDLEPMGKGKGLNAGNVGKFLAGTAHGMVNPLTDVSDIMKKGGGAGKLFAVLGLLLSVKDMVDGADRVALDAIDEGKIATLNEKAEGSGKGLVQGITGLYGMAKFLISTKVFGQAAEDANVAAFGKDTFYEKSGRVGETLGSTVGSALGYDEQLVSLEKELKTASGGFSGFKSAGGDPQKTKEAYLSYMRRGQNSQRGGSFLGHMAGTEMNEFMQTLDDEANSKDMTGDEYYDFLDLRKTKVAEKRKELQVQFQKDRFPEQLKRADKIRDLMTKILETRAAREKAMASSQQNTTVVQNVNKVGGNSGTGTNTSGMSSIDLNAGAVPGFAP